MLLYKSLTNPHTTRRGLVGELTLNFVWRQYKGSPIVVRYTTDKKEEPFLFLQMPLPRGQFYVTIPHPLPGLG